MNEDICLDTCVRRAYPRAQVQHHCAWLLFLQGWMHGYVCSRNGSDLCRVTGELSVEVRCVQ